MSEHGRFPLRVQLVPAALHADVYRHDLSAGPTGAIPCWTYVTDGLRAHGQKEIALTLRRLATEEPADFPRAPLDLFRAVQPLAARGQLVDESGLTELGGQFLGEGDFRAVGYLAPQLLPGLPAPAAPWLTAILLTDGERAVANAAGVTRVAARLGQAYSHYPFPPWSERSRPSVASADEITHSIVDRMPRLALRATVRKEGNEVRLTLPPEAPALFARELPKVPPRMPLCLLTAVDAGADALLVWHPGQAAPAAIAAPGADGMRLGGAFCAFLSEQAADYAQLFEDGYVVMLTDATWAAVREDLAAGRARDVAPTRPDGLSFALRLGA
jgi:hypothetical protein